MNNGRHDENEACVHDTAHHVYSQYLLIVDGRQQPRLLFQIC